MPGPGDVVLITGAARGIGRELALRRARLRDGPGDALGRVVRMADLRTRGLLDTVT